MSFFQKLRGALARFMYGRYGNDTLNQFLCVLILVLYVLGLFLSWVPVLGTVLFYLPTVLWLVVLFRMLSRNYEKRRRENAWLLSWWGPLKNSVRRRRDRMRDREHKYFTCRGCGTVCRVPRGRGKIIITCPRCGREIRGKS
ncbi:MAG: hypothetical protein ACI3WR_01375 [Oscillospiraceae bacterium]